jgi:hypothetical protein
LSHVESKRNYKEKHAKYDKDSTDEVVCWWIPPEEVYNTEDYDGDAGDKAIGGVFGYDAWSGFGWSILRGCRRKTRSNTSRILVNGVNI